MESIMYNIAFKRAKFSNSEKEKQQQSKDNSILQYWFNEINIKILEAN